jgi:hypothetical protein
VLFVATLRAAQRSMANNDLGLAGKTVRESRSPPRHSRTFFGFEEQPVPENNLPRSLAQAAAVPTSPGVRGGLNSCSTLRPHLHKKNGLDPLKCHGTQVTESVWPSSVIAALFQCLGRMPAQKSLLRASSQFPAASPT